MDYYAAKGRIFTECQVHKAKYKKPDAKAMYCVIPFAGYPGEGKYVSAEDTEVAAIARNWILTAKGHMIFFKVQSILYLNFDGGHTIVSICQNS